MKTEKTAKKELLTAKQILDRTLETVAPLPSQEKYLRDLARIFALHLNRNTLIDQGFHPDDLPNSSSVVVATTGQGKSYLIRKMAEAVELNIVPIDCSSLTAEGYKGLNLTQAIGTALVQSSNPEMFERSILFLDEVDKLRLTETSREGNPIRNILRLFNGAPMSFELGQRTYTISSDRFCVLFGGAFVGLEEIVRDRLFPSSRKIGFTVLNDEPLSDGELLGKANLQDMVEYGLIPELMGRIGTVLHIPPLTVEDYKQLLTAEKGSQKAKYRDYLQNMHGVEFDITDAAIQAIADECMEAETGARAVNPAINDVMRGALDAVEDDFEINKVILDTDENGLCARFERGSRAKTVYNKPKKEDVLSAEPAPVIRYITKRDKVQLVSSLLRYHSKAGGDKKDVPLLEAFLWCAVPFLFDHCAPKERTLGNCIKLAEVAQRNRNSGVSPFDIIMGDFKMTDDFAYKELQRNYDYRCSIRLVNALRAIRDYLFKFRYPCEFQFKLSGTVSPFLTDEERKALKKKRKFYRGWGI